MYPQLPALSGKYWALSKYLMNEQIADKTYYFIYYIYLVQNVK